MGKRLFLGLELPAYCCETLVEIDPRIKRVRWVRPEQLHLTMSFLGDVDANHEERLRETLAGINVPPFFLPIRGIGTFGGQRPVAIWAGVGKGHPHLFALYKHMQDAALRAGLEPDLRPFHPHITLARPRGVAAATLKAFLRQHGEAEFGMFAVKEFVLFSSKLSAEGSIYKIELRQSLK